MRDIKFRGKTEVSGKWCYGNLCIRIDGAMIITPDETPLGTYGKVDRNTVGQYTGLKDKNGTEIYEGDRVYIIPEDEEGVIEWDRDSARFIIIHDDVATDFDDWYGADLEVVGDIYDSRYKQNNS